MSDPRSAFNWQDFQQPFVAAVSLAATGQVIRDRWVMIANPAMKNEFAKTKEEIALDVHREQKRVLREQEKTARRKVKSGGIPENPLYGLSRKGDEQIRLHKLKLKEQQIIAHKPANAFNAPITTPEQARRTKNIARNS